MIQVHNLKKKFDDFQALNRVDMHVGKGVIFMDWSDQTERKSTLIRHLLRLTQRQMRERS